MLLFEMRPKCNIGRVAFIAIFMGTLKNFRQIIVSFWVSSFWPDLLFQLFVFLLQLFDLLLQFLYNKILFVYILFHRWLIFTRSLPLKVKEIVRRHIPVHFWKIWNKVDPVHFLFPFMSSIILWKTQNIFTISMSFEGPEKKLLFVFWLIHSRRFGFDFCGCFSSKK